MDSSSQPFKLIPKGLSLCNSSAKIFSFLTQPVLQFKINFNFLCAVTCSFLLISFCAIDDTVDNSLMYFFKMLY